MNKKEIEATLAVVAENPQEILKIIEKKEILNEDFILENNVELSIRDCYFDLNSRPLGRQKISLRLRDAGGRCFITLKGKSKITEYGTERAELELPWSAGALKKIIKELKTNEIEITAQKEQKKTGPFQALQELGFDIIQERITERKIKNVTESGTGVLLAEMALDRVGYKFNQRKITHYEIEIEAKKESKKAFLAVKKIKEALIKGFPGVFMEWEISKYATGKAMEELLSRGDLNDMDGMEKTEIYEKIRLNLL